MYFKRIDLHGFKSFAEPASIEFHNGITCIVGPNGSGKSNISDAIRWVLGEQSPKMLRGGKMEEVIFAGTASRKSRGMAEVTLVIDNTAGILPIDFSEVAITRRMYRSGESEYAINNNPCRLRDIRELIMDTGIGVEGYSLIGQGRIADIVGGKPESRREIFEEAAGIVMYRSRKAESERKLETASANLERVNDIVSEIESRIGNLKEDSEKATEYLALRERYKTLEINITLKNIENIELKNEYVIDDITETGVEIEELREEKASIDGKTAAAREKTEILERLMGETRDKLMSSIATINEMVNKSQLSAERLAGMERDCLRLAQEIASYEERLAREEENAEELRKTREEATGRLNAAQAALREKAEEYARRSAELSKMTEEIDSRKNELFSLHNQISAKAAETGSLSNMRQVLDRRRDQILAEGQAIHRQGEDVREALSVLALEQEQLSSDLSGIAHEREKNQQMRADALLAERRLSRELSEKQMETSRVSARKKTIEEMESNYEGYGGAVRFIMKAKLPGVVGVVAELIKVPAGYEVAVETALGASLQNIVTRDDPSAQAAIAMLKEHKEGRLTFLPVSSIRSGGSRDAGLAKAAGFIGYGVDCVSFDPQYKNVMEYLLGRVAVVDTLANAIKLSKNTTGGFRFVTLEGEIINAGGAITGGAYKNRTANLLERRAEIDLLGAQLAELTREGERLSGQLSEQRNLIEETAAAALALDARHREAEIALLSKENEAKAAQNALEDFNRAQGKREEELGNIGQEKQGAEEMIRSLETDVAEAKARIAEIEDAAEAAMEVFDRLKAESEITSEEITKARIAVSACEGELASAAAMEERVEGSIRESAQEKDRRKEEHARILSEREKLLSGGEGSAEDLIRKEEEKTAAESYLAELTEERAAAMRALTESTQEKEALDERIGSLQMHKYELEIKKTKHETQLEGYKEKLWEEFEISYIQAVEFKKKDFAMPQAVKESREIKNRIKELGEVNVGAIREYETVGERYEFLTKQRADLLEGMGALRQIIEDMDKTIRAKFKESFDKVVMNFEEVFKELFGGGTAELRLENEDKPLESGIEIVAQPPGKKLQNLNLMSGGEKTMTAIALMFAVLRTKPTPFCILDEIEAALDDANIDRFAKYLRSFEGIQFALVTHQKATMQHADVLYGVTMPEQGISKLISLRLGEEFEL